MLTNSVLGVRFAWSGTGTGDVVAGSAEPGFVLPDAASDGIVQGWEIQNLSDASEREVLKAAWDEGTGTLLRSAGTILQPTGGAIDFSAGTKIVSLVPLPGDFTAADGGTIDLTAIDLSAEYWGADQTLSDDVELALDGAITPVGSMLLRLDAADFDVTVDGTSVRWADDATTRTWNGLQTLGVAWNPAEGIAEAVVTTDPAVGSGAVDSVNGQTGTVVLDAADVGAVATGDVGTAAGLDVPASGDAASGEVVKGDDSRLTDDRDPTAHASSHGSGGGDPVTLAESQVTNLVTDLAGKQALATLLTNIAALSMVADRYIYGTGTNAVALGTITSFIRTLLDDADAATAIATLGAMDLSTAQSVAAGIKKTFQAGATNAGLRLAGVTGNPSTVVAGDFWYRSDTEKVTYRGASSTRALVAEALAQTLTNKTLAGAAVTGELALGSGGSMNDAGPITASGSLTRATHGGRWVVTSGNVTVPNASGDVGMGGVIRAGGAHTITFNSTVTAALTSGDVVTYYVESTTVIYAVKSGVANKLAFT